MRKSPQTSPMAEQNPRPYLRDGVAGLPMEAQEDALRIYGVPLADAFRDRLTQTQIKRRDPADLTMRSEMLRTSAGPTPETIYVASLRVFGWTMGDIARALAAAGRRRANICAVDTGRTILAKTLNADLLESLAEAEKERLRGQTTPARSVGVRAAAKSREQRREARLKEAHPLWIASDAEISAADIAARAGLSVTTLKRHFGSRGDAREKAKQLGAAS